MRGQNTIDVKHQENQSSDERSTITLSFRDVLLINFTNAFKLHAVLINNLHSECKNSTYIKIHSNLYDKPRKFSKRTDVEIFRPAVVRTVHVTGF